MRLFVAVWPSAEAAGALHAIDRTHSPGARWTRPEQWHVTLRFLGEVGEDAVAGLTAALGTVRAGRRRVTMGPATACLNRRVLVVPVAGLDDLAAATSEASSSFGGRRDDRPFSGHLTVARGRDLLQLAGRPVSASWVVDELTLVRSTTRRDGATYDVLARFPLS